MQDLYEDLAKKVLKLQEENKRLRQALENISVMLKDVVPKVVTGEYVAVPKQTAELVVSFFENFPRFKDALKEEVVSELKTDLQKLIDQASKLTEKTKAVTKLTPDQLRLLLMLKKHSNVIDLSDSLALSPEVVQHNLDILASLGYVEERNGQWFLTNAGKRVAEVAG